MFLVPKAYRDDKELERTEKRFADEFAAAQKFSDPAERLEATLRVKDGIDRYRRYMNSECDRRTGLIEVAILLPELFGSIVGGVLVTAAINPVLGIGLLVGGLAGGLYSLLSGKLQEKLEQSVDDQLGYHRRRIGDVSVAALKDVRQLLETRNVDIAASAKFGSIYDNFPEVRDSFIKTFNQTVARSQLRAPPSSGPVQPKFAL
jgi:hypothetical protein